MMVNGRSRGGGSGWQPPRLGNKEVRADERDQPDDDEKIRGPCGATSRERFSAGPTMEIAKSPGIDSSGAADEASLPQLTPCASGSLHFIYRVPVRRNFRRRASCSGWRRTLQPSKDALTSFSILSNIRPGFWGVPCNGKDLAMFRWNIFSIRRAPSARQRRAVPLPFTLL